VCIHSIYLCCPGVNSPTSKGQPAARIMQHKSRPFCKYNPLTIIRVLRKTCRIMPPGRTKQPCAFTAVICVAQVSAAPLARGNLRLLLCIRKPANLQIQSSDNHKSPQENLPHNATWAHQAAMHITTVHCAAQVSAAPLARGNLRLV
jgi:hypothetical protein